MRRNLNQEMSLSIKLVGALDIFLQDPKTGKVVEERHVKNTIVDGGEILVAELLAGEEYGGSTLSYAAGELGYGIQYVQVGESTATTTQGMYALQSQGGVSGNYYAAIDNDVSSPGNIIVSRGTFSTSNGNGALTEAGLFTNNINTQTSKTDTSCRMFNRTTFATVNKTTSFAITFQWTITIGSVS